MNTSTPVRKWKTTCGHFENTSNSLLKVNGEDALHGNDSILRQDLELITEESEIEVFTQKFNECSANKSQELFPFSPITHPKEVPRSLLPLLDPPLKFSSPILTPYCVQSQNVSPAQDSDDTFVHTVYRSTSERTQTHYSRSEIASRSKNVDIFQYSNEDDIFYSEGCASSLEIPGSPILASQKKKKKSGCNVNKNLFSFPESQCTNADGVSPVLVDSYEVSDASTNAVNRVREIKETAYLIGSPAKGNHAHHNDLDYSFSNSFDVCENGTVEAILEDGDKKNFVYPFKNVQKPSHAVLVDDILESVLPLEQTDLAKTRSPPARAHKFRPGLVSFNELSTLPDYADECDYSLPLSTWNEFDVRTCPPFSARENKAISIKPSARTRFCRAIFANREIYGNLKKYFEYYRVDFARAVSTTDPTEVRKEIANAFNGSESHRCAYLTDKAINKHLSECWQTLNNVPFTLVGDFFDFFRVNLFLVYNFNILSGGRRLRSKIIMENRRKERKKRQRDTCSSEFEMNLVLDGATLMSLCRDEEVTSLTYEVDVNQSPVRKILRSSYEFDDSILEQFNDSFTIDNIPGNVSDTKPQFRTRAKELCDELDEDLDISETMLTDLCESVEKSNGCDRRNGSSISATDNSMNRHQLSTSVNETTLIGSSSFCRRSSFDNVIENSLSNIQVPSTGYHSTTGFQTASGKVLAVDEKSLMRGRKLLYEGLDDICYAEETPLEKVTGFSAASGMRVSIDEKSFHESETCGNSSTVGMPLEDSLAVGTGKQYCVGDDSFDTRMESFGAEALTGSWPTNIDSPGGRALTAGKSIDNEKLPVKGRNMPHEISHVPATLAGFRTASGKSLGVSGEAMVAAQKLFDSVTNDAETAKTLGVNICELDSEKLASVFAESSVIRSKRAFDDVLDDTQTNSRQAKNPRTSSSPLTKKFPASNATADKSRRTDEILGNSVDLQGEVEKTKFAGFGAKNGRRVNVNEPAVASAKKTFENVNVGVDTNAEQPASSSMAGEPSVDFEQKLSVLEDRQIDEFVRMKKINQNFDTVSKTPETNWFADDVNVTDKEDVPKLDFACFSTARGKRIAVNEKSLAAAKNLFDTCAKATPENVQQVSSQNVNEKSSSPKLAAFSTARGKRINVDEKSLTAAKKLFDIVSEESEATVADKEGYCGAEFAAFSTASGKQVAVNKASLYNAKKLFDSVSKEAEITSVGGEDQCGPKFAAFSTASGKQVAVNKASLHRAKKLFDSVSKEAEIATVGGENQCGPNLAAFNTASGKPVAVSDTALCKAKKIFDGDSQETEVVPTKKDEYCGPKFAAFSTASGKQVAVNEASLHKAKKLFDSVSREAETVTVGGEDQCEPKFAAFSTASGKQMAVNKASLHKAKKLFDTVAEEMEVTSADGEIRCGPKFAGFNTAGGKPVAVNEKAFRKAKQLLEIVSQETEMTTADGRSHCESKFAGFSTASGKHVDVNSKSLALAKKLYDTVAKETETNASRLSGRKISSEDNLNDFESSSSNNTADRSQPVSQTTAKKSSKVGIKAENISQQFSAEEGNRNVQLDATTPSNYKSSSRAGEEPTDVTNESTDLVKNKVDDVFNSLDVDQFFADSDDKITSASKPAPDCTIDERKLPVPLQDITLNSETLLDLEIIGYLSGDSEKYSKLEGTNITREVSESTSAFLFDMKEDKRFVPPTGASPVCPDSVDKSETTESMSEYQRSKGGGSSPVFDSNKLHRRKKNKKRRSQCSLSMTPLDVTYSRKDNESVVCDKTSPEDVFKMFKDNFAQRCVKRKEPASSTTCSASKKCKERGERNEQAEERRRAAVDQQNYVQAKDGESCKQRRGTYLTRKMNEKRKTLREMVQNERPRRYTVDKLLQMGLKRSVVVVDAENARNFVFTSDFLNSTTATYGDECRIIPNENNEVGFDELARAFLASPGVDPHLISIPWIRNHYRWIIWKLASTERSFPRQFGAAYLTLDNVLWQLKFRYDWEVDRCQRSALRKILECDDSASKTMVLCVATIKPIASSVGEYEIELTDGWYSIGGLIDFEMNKFISKKRVTVGTKLMIMNAELIGLSEGCDPLQVTDGVRLKIATNSVRRVRWDTPLGFYCGKSIVVRKLQSVLRNGGVIPQLIAVVARVYPLTYLGKKEDGSSELFNEKIHFKRIAEHEKKRQACLETLVSQISKEVQRENCASDSDDFKNLSQSDYSDPAMFQDRRYGEQEKLRALIEERVKSKLPAEFKERRQASCMLKVRLINNEVDKVSSSALLTIWHPNEDLISLLSEGKVYNLRNVVTNGSRNGDVRLSTNRLTTYETQTATAKVVNVQRRVTEFDDLKADYACPFGEIDAVGVVLSVTDSAYEADKYRQQTVYLVDLEQNIIAISFRSSIKDFGYEDTLRRKHIIGCLNLQWKRGFLYWKIPIVFACEFTSFVHKSRHKHLQKRIEDFDCYFKSRCIDAFLTECDTKLEDVIASPGPVATSTPLKSRGGNDEPAAERTSALPADASANVSLPSSRRSDNSFDGRTTNSKSVRSRIEKLRGYGEPPPLSPITLSAAAARPKRARLSIQTRVFKSGDDQS